MGKAILALYGISGVCLWVLLSAVILNFLFCRMKNENVIYEKKSIVETGSMFCFFLIMAFLVYKRVGAIRISGTAEIIMVSAGTAIIVAGTAVNIAGRLSLKGNWGNQIKIYETHTLVTDGIYRYIRHPLYSSTILMIFGFSLIFVNPLVFILNALIFTPFMVYRAKQEDEILKTVFKDRFTSYKIKTGLFIPKIRK